MADLSNYNDIVAWEMMSAEHLSAYFDHQAEGNRKCRFHGNGIQQGNLAAFCSGCPSML